MPTKPVAPVSRSAPSGTGGVKGWDTGIGTPAVECERPGCRADGAGATASGRTFTTANPPGGPGHTQTLLAGRDGAQTLASARMAGPPWVRSSRVLQVVQRVRHRAVDPHLEVEVRAEAQAGAAADADDLALADVRPERGGEARLVGVARRQRRGVRDARVVAVAARRARRLHERDLARGGRADRRPARHADVDAGMARLPRAALAERRGDRPVDGPDHAAVALPDRARGQRAGRLLQRPLDLALLGLQRRQRALQVLARGAGLLQRALLVRPRAVQPDARVDQALLNARDLVAVGEHDRGDALLARGEALQARLGRGRVGAGGADDPDDPLVLLGDTLHELAALEQVGEAVRVEDHVDDVRDLGAVELDEPLGERGARLRQALAQPHEPAALVATRPEPAALVAQLVLELRELRLLAVEVGLHGRLAALEPPDPRLQRADALVVRADLAREDALGPLAPADAALRGLDLLLDVVEAALRRSPVRRKRQGRPERERERRTRD